MITLLRRLRHSPAVKDLGPGLITGAADDDPSGIATYSQAGAQFGFDMLWTVLLTYAADGRHPDGQRADRPGHRPRPGGQYPQHLPRWLLYAIVGLLLVANTINIAADIAAMGEALRLLRRRLGASVYASPSASLSLAAADLHSLPAATCRILKWLTLSLLAYVAVVFAVHVPWLEVVHAHAAARTVLDSRLLT